MKTSALPNGAELVPLKHTAAEAPHATVEVNSECNIRCRHCYNVDRAATKPLEQIRSEIDTLLSRRRLDTISLVGGEPTLHPQLPDIVAYVRSRGLYCQVVTNGVRLLQDPGDRLLGALVRAGVSRFLIHVDDGQRHVHGDVVAARHEIFRRLERHQVAFTLTVTLGPGDEETLPRILRENTRYRFFEGVFVAMAMDMATCFDPDRSTAGDPELGKVHRCLLRELRVEPTGYLPSSLDDQTICWLMYFYYLNVDTGETFALSPRFNRGFRWLYRRLRGREFFGEPADPAWRTASFAITALAELAIAPRRLGRLLRLLRRAGGTRALRFQYVVIQESARYDPEHGRVSVCYQCPDATLRAGRLTPVCVASWLSPADGGPPKAPRRAVEDIYRHLEPEVCDA